MSEWLKLFRMYKRHIDILRKEHEKRKLTAQEKQNFYDYSTEAQKCLFRHELLEIAIERGIVISV